MKMKIGLKLKLVITQQKIPFDVLHSERKMVTFFLKS